MKTILIWVLSFAVSIGAVLFYTFADYLIAILVTAIVILVALLYMECKKYSQSQIEKNSRKNAEIAKLKKDCESKEMTYKTEIEKLQNQVDVYATAARTIALYLNDFCDKTLPYHEMIADASRKASAEIERLKKGVTFTFTIEDFDRIKEDVFKKIDTQGIKSTAVNEVVQKLGTKIIELPGLGHYEKAVVLGTIENVVDEMRGEEK